LFVNTFNREDRYSCVIKGWKENHVKYSSVWQDAERVLGIIASSDPSERIFSCAGKVVTNKRCRLNSETVHMLVTVSKNADGIDWEFKSKKNLRAEVLLTGIVCSVN
jgi:hypothetical protein